MTAAAREQPAPPRHIVAVAGLVTHPSVIRPRIADADLSGVVIEDANIEGLTINGFDIATLIANATADANTVANASAQAPAVPNASVVRSD